MSELILLSGLPKTFEQAVANALTAQGFQCLTLHPSQQPPTQNHTHFQLHFQRDIDWLKTQLQQQFPGQAIKALVNAAFLSPVKSVHPSQTVLRYPPKALYDLVLTKMRAEQHGRLISCYGAPGQQLLPRTAVFQLFEALNAQFKGCNILSNALSLALPAHASADQQSAIFTARVKTVVWLCTVTGQQPHRRFLRGYTDERLSTLNSIPTDSAIALAH